MLGSRPRQSVPRQEHLPVLHPPNQRKGTVAMTTVSGDGQQPKTHLRPEHCQNGLLLKLPSDDVKRKPQRTLPVDEGPLP